MICWYIPKEKREMVTCECGGPKIFSPTKTKDVESVRQKKARTLRSRTSYEEIKRDEEATLEAF